MLDGSTWFANGIDLLWIVEDYRRTSKNVDNAEAEKPPADNEVRVSHSKIPVYVDACLKLLQVSIASALMLESH